MKQVFTSFLLTLLMSMVGTKTFAYDFSARNADGVTIFYKIINNDKELEVTYEYDTSPSYSGIVNIPENVTDLNITRKVTRIGEFAFFECTELKSITIPNSVTEIGKKAFFGCEDLSSITIPNSVTIIGDCAFQSAHGLTSVKIGDGVVSMGESVFEYCSNLTSVTIGNGLTSINSNTFGSCISLTSITIPNSVTKIKERGFCGCISLTSITIPNSVTSIGLEAFENCRSLNSVTIGSGVSSIDAIAFNDAENITKVISLNENPTNIDSYAFTDKVYNNATLYIPIGTIDKYKSKEGWKKFANIVEGSPSSISDIQSVNANVLKRYTLDGRVIKNSHKGINIIQMNNGTTKKVNVR